MTQVPDRAHDGGGIQGAAPPATAPSSSMHLSDYKRDYYDFSGKASDVARSVAFAGVAIVWIFRVSGSDGPKPPGSLLLPLALLAAGLGLDLLHYIWGAATWGLFHRYHESKLGDPGGPASRPSGVVGAADPLALRSEAGGDSRCLLGHRRLSVVGLVSRGLTQRGRTGVCSRRHGAVARSGDAFSCSARAGAGRG